MIYEILSLGAGGVSKTQIIFRVNLSHKLAEKYLVFLVKKGLLTIETGLEGTRYFLTKRGERLFHLLRDVVMELNEFYAMSLSTEMKPLDQASRSRPKFGSERGRVPIEIQRASTS